MADSDSLSASPKVSMAINPGNCILGQGNIQTFHELLDTGIQVDTPENKSVIMVGMGPCEVQLIEGILAQVKLIEGPLDLYIHMVVYLPGRRMYNWD